MAVKNLKELFEHELKDIYYAEHRLVEALEELASESKHRDAKRAYTTHKRETQGQIKRLQKVFKLFGEAPEPEKCPGIEGLLKEKQNFTKKEKPSQEILDFFNLGAAAKTERYEITAYESLVAMAQQLGMEKAVELLMQNLQEEQATLEKLQMMAEQYNVAALMPQEEEEPAASGSSKKGGASKGAAKGSTKSSKSAASSQSSRNGSSTRNSPSKGAARRGGSKGTSSKGTSSNGTSSSRKSTGARRGGGTGSSGPGSGTEPMPEMMQPQMGPDTV